MKYAFLFIALLLVSSDRPAFAIVVWSERDAAELSQATLACKVKLGTIIQKGPMGSPAGTEFCTTCKVISTLKGKVEAGSELQITFRRNWNGPHHFDEESVTDGEIYIIMLRGKTAPYEMFAAMKAVDAVVEPTFGTKPGDRLMAELAAMWKSKDEKMRLMAIKQIGYIRDRRGSKEADEAARDKDAKMAKAGVIALYCMKIPPDAKRVMELFDAELQNVWYQESGIPLKDAKGRYIRSKGPEIERGVPGFDYATYVREGIKLDWVRKDDNSLYEFFGVPWKVHRKQCAPELIKLLDHPDKRVRGWAIKCLRQIIEAEDRKWYMVANTENEWRIWWKEKGNAFMAEPETSRDGKSLPLPLAP